MDIGSAVVGPIRCGVVLAGIALISGALPAVGLPVASAAPAGRTATWTSVNLPNVTDHPDSGLVQGQLPPYTLFWPGEGTSSTGEQDPGCSPPAPYRNGRHVRTGAPQPDDKLIGLLGFWKRGPFVRVGNPTPGANHGANHLGVFFHTPDLDGKPCYRGGSEYGFFRALAEGSTMVGDQPLDFYQCWNCNCKPSCATDRRTVSERYTSRQTGWKYSAADRIYRVSFANFPVSSSGATCASPIDNYSIEVLDPAVSPATRAFTTKICRASWMPDLKGGAGWITGTAHADRYTGDGADRFAGSYNQVTTVKWLHT